MNYGLSFKLDYRRLLKCVERWYEAKCVIPIYYTPEVRSRALRERQSVAADSGYVVVTTPPNSDGDIQFDLGRYHEKYDVLVLVSGDNGFADLLARLGRQGKMINVLNPSPRVSHQLQEVCGFFGNYMSLAEMRGEVEYR